MASIGDFLSREDKREVIVESVACGDVFKMNLTIEEGIQPKHENEVSRDKYIVIIDKTDTGDFIGFSVVNSKINNNIKDNHLSHYPISAKKYDFLSHNSFIDCSEIKEIKADRFAYNFDTSCGKIEDYDMNLVIEAIKNSKNMTPKN